MPEKYWKSPMLVGRVKDTANPLFPASGPATGSFNGLHTKRELSLVDSSPGA